MLAVANFHYIRTDFTSEYPSIFGRTPGEFEFQLQELSRQGKFISQEDLLDNRISEGDKAILITFDDGLKEQFELARPILDRMGIPFICFINTANFKEQKLSMVHKIHLLRSLLHPANIENELVHAGIPELSIEEKNKAHFHYNYDPPEVAQLKYLLNFKLKFSELPAYIDPLFQNVFNEEQVAKNLYMTHEQLQRLYKAGSLASHGHQHLPLAMLSKPDLHENLKKTQNFFLKKFGKRSSLLSYPYGSSESCMGISRSLEKEGFKFAFTMERAVSRNPTKNPFLIPRYDCNDLPGGKFNIFKGKAIFENPAFSSWH
jgi:peptidoglycan/xylan/chitin deacetylase (PgdA/CDA1 family)